MTECTWIQCFTFRFDLWLELNVFLLYHTWRFLPVLFLPLTISQFTGDGCIQLCDDTASCTCSLTPICALFINARLRLMSFSVLKIWCSRAELRSGAFFYRWYVQNLQRWWPTLNLHSGNNSKNGSETVLILVWVLWIDGGLLTGPNSIVHAVL